MMSSNRPMLLITLKQVVAISLIGCLAIASANAMTFKIATLSPEGSSWMKLMRQGAAEVKRKTDGRVTFKFYPGGVMGDERAVLRKMRIGQLHGGAITSSHLDKFFSDNQIYNLPVQFNSFDEVDHVREQMDQVIVDGLYKNGIVTFGLAEGGFAYLMSKTPITSITELREHKVWIPVEDTVSTETARALALAPIPLSPSEVRTGLQTGLIDTVAASPIIAIALRWHTQINYVTDTPLLYIYGVLAVDRRAFEKITPADQKIVNSVMRSVWQKVDHQNREENIEALGVLRSRGVQFVQIDPAAKKELRRIAAKVPERMIKSGKLSRSMFEQFNQYLTEYRAKSSSAK